MRRLSPRSPRWRTRSLAGASRESRVGATRLAEAQADLGRIAGVRLALTERLMAGADVTRELLRLDRYERRALGRRSRALSELDAAAWVDLRSGKSGAPAAT